MTDTAKKSVLIIDDEEDFCLLMKNLLRRQASEVAYALTMQQGLLQVAERQPDLILLDNNLPDGPGIQFIAELRGRHADARIVMVSAMGHLQHEAIARGADAFLEKPINLSDLLSWF